MQNQISYFNCLYYEINLYPIHFYAYPIQNRNLQNAIKSETREYYITIYKLIK